MNYRIYFSKQAQKDATKLAKSNLKQNAQSVLDILKDDPFKNPPRFETLSGILKGCYSRRINIQHRVVYEVFEQEKKVHVLRMWPHYGE